MWIIVYTCLCMACDCQANIFTANYNCFLQLSYYILIYIVLIFQHTSMNWVFFSYVNIVHAFIEFISVSFIYSFVYVVDLHAFFCLCHWPANFSLVCVYLVYIACIYMMALHICIWLMWLFWMCYFCLCYCLAFISLACVCPVYIISDYAIVQSYFCLF